MVLPTAMSGIWGADELFQRKIGRVEGELCLDGAKNFGGSFVFVELGASHSPMSGRFEGCGEEAVCGGLGFTQGRADVGVPVSEGLLID